MTRILDVTIPGNPFPKERPRTARGRTYTPPKTEAAELLVAAHVRKAFDEPAPVTSAVVVGGAFYREGWVRCDLDNLVKLVLDAMNGLVYTDDFVVMRHEFDLHRGVPKGEGRTHVWVDLLERETLSPTARRRESRT